MTLANDNDRAPAIHAGAFYFVAEVSALIFNRSPSWFRKRRADLRRRQFPEPVSRIGRPRWSGEALLAWLAMVEGDPFAEPSQRGLDQLLGERGKRVARRCRRSPGDTSTKRKT